MLAGHGYWGQFRRREKTRAQAMVEFALAFPLFMVIVLAIIQFSIVFIWYFSITRMTRDTARWLAVNRHATETTVRNYVTSTALPGIVVSPAGTPSNGTGTTASSVVMGRLTLRFTACEVSGSECTNDNREEGETLYVEMQYDVGNVMFFPTTIGMGSYTVNLPTTLPPYRVYVMAE